MAKAAESKPTENKPVNAEADDSGKSLEEIQREIALVQLETAQLDLEESKKRNAEFKQREQQRRKHNRQRMTELADARGAAESLVAQCRHKSGGNPQNVLKGGGIGSFSIISRALMPDGVTVFLQCARCRMKRFFRRLSPAEETRLQKGDAGKYQYYAEAKRLYEISVEEGLEHAELRGPTFLFQNEQGVPIIPEMR